MNLLRTFLVVLALQLNLSASEITLLTGYIPVESTADSPVTVVSVPFYSNPVIPEALIYAITQPYVVKQGDAKESYDMNLASVAKLSIACTYLYNIDKGKAYYIEWDFTKADPKLINKDLIAGVIKCIRKSLGDRIVIYSKFIGVEKFHGSKKQIITVYPLVPKDKQG